LDSGSAGRRARIWSSVGTVAWWTAPAVLCLAVQGLALRTWFLADDFMLLGRARDCLEGRDGLLSYIFTPIGQGTVRILSERVFFLVLYRVFGMESLPFRVAVFLTQFANLALVAWIVRRLSGSALAGLVAASLWVFNFASVTVLTWTASYNEVQLAFFVLCAFHFLLRYAATGRQRYWVLQWAAYLLGFGALELNVVYPALACAYALLFARSLLRRTLWLFLPALGFTVLHRMAALPATGIYAMHFDLHILDTLRTYWEVALGLTWLRSFLPPWLPLFPRLVAAITMFVSAAPLAYAAWSVRARRWLPLFCLGWFVIVLSPLLPLRDHVAEYYVFVPSIGVAMLGGEAVARAARGRLLWRCVALAWIAGYVAGLLPAVRQHGQWLHELSVRAHWVVRGVARAHADHPGKVILLHGADGDIVWTTVTNRAYNLVDAEVFLTPETAAVFAAHPSWEAPELYVLPAEATRKALADGKAVVYEIGTSDLREITSTYVPSDPLSGAAR